MKYQKEIYFLGDMAVIYFIARDIPAVTVVPRSMAEAVNDDKMAHMLYPAFGHCAPMPMADIALQGDGCSQNFSAGNFMHMTETSRSMRFSGRKKSERGNRVEIVTELSDGRIRAEHTVAWKKDGVVLEFFIYSALSLVCSGGNARSPAELSDLRTYPLWRRQRFGEHRRL